MPKVFEGSPIQAVSEAAEPLSGVLHMTTAEVAQLLLVICHLDNAGARAADIGRLLCASSFAEGDGYCERVAQHER